MAEFNGLLPGGLLPATALGQLDTVRREVVAAGRPDIPATTPYTQAELDAMPSGTEYRSIDGPQGAWKWRKSSANGWVCTEGTTGRRRLTLNSAAGFTAGIVEIIRVDSTVYLSVSSLTRPAAATGYAKVADIPTGFQPTLAAYVQAILGTYGYVDGSGLNLNRPGLAESLSQTWITQQAWPTTLPGTAA